MRWWVVVGAVAAVGVLAPAASRSGVFGNPVETKARRDEAFLVAKGDGAMQAAYARGRATLPGFLAVSERRPPNARAFAVKLPVRDGVAVEYFWIKDFTRDGDRFRGAIDNTPRLVATVRQGELVSFDRSEIVDWMYVQDGRMKGNFTACALLAKEEPAAAEAFKRKFKMDCEA